MREDSGQMMLISAFLLAIAIVTITIMLNNVIYSSNMAYAGFMDQTRYDDISFKEATTKEAAYAYTIEPSANYGIHMEDYEKALNNLVSLKGRYIELTSSRDPVPANPLLNPTRTMTTMTFYGNDAKVSYVLYTGDDGVDPPAPNPPSVPVVATVYLSSSMTSIISTVDYAILTCKVVDASGTPLSGVSVTIDANDRRDTAGNPIAAAPEILNMGGSATIPLTDGNGEVKVMYRDLNVYPGSVNIIAYTQGINSLPVHIDVFPPYCTEHDIGFDVPIINPTGSGGKYVIMLPLDFTGFTNGQVDNSNILSVVSSNILIKTPPVYYSYYGSTPDVIVTEVELIDKNDLNMYTLQLTFEVTATCTQHAPDPDKPYDKIVSLTIRRDRILSGITFTTPP
jgi:hypothetical protein